MWLILKALAGVLVHLVFLWTALTRVRPNHAVAGYMMAVGACISLLASVLAPVISTVGTSGMEAAAAAIEKEKLGGIMALVEFGGVFIVAIAIVLLSRSLGNTKKSLERTTEEAEVAKRAIEEASKPANTDKSTNTDKSAKTSASEPASAEPEVL